MTGERGLRGLRVLVTSSDAHRLAGLLSARGAESVTIPTIAIRSSDPAPLDAALARAQRYAWIVVTSANGARRVAARLHAQRLGPPAGPRWAAVGPRTAEVLRAAGVEHAFVPAEGTGAAIAAALGDVAGRSVLLVRARAATEDLPRMLEARGAEVDEVPAYETEEGPEASRAPLAAALEPGIDAVVFASGSAVRGFARLAGEPARALAGAIVVAIGPTAAAAARAAGLDPLVARERTPEALVAALEHARGARWQGTDRTTPHGASRTPVDG